MRWLEQIYDRTFGQGARRGQLYVGFYLAAGGTLLGIAALALDLVAEAQDVRSSVSKWREGAIFLGAIAAPLVLLGFSFALPARRSLRFVGAAAAATTFGVAVAFLFHYPYNFNVPGAPVADYTVIDVSIYAAGLVTLVAGVVTQIVGIYVRRNEGDSDDPNDWTSTDYDVPDWIIERDIEEAEKKYPVSIAGGSQPSGVHINIPDALPSDAVVRGRGAAKRIHIQSPDLDAKTDRLRGIRTDTVHVSANHDATSALMQLNRARKENPKLFKPPGFWHSLWAHLFRRKRNRHERLRKAFQSE